MAPFNEIGETSEGFLGTQNSMLCLRCVAFGIRLRHSDGDVSYELKRKQRIHHRNITN